MVDPDKASLFYVPLFLSQRVSSSECPATTRGTRTRSKRALALTPTGAMGRRPQRYDAGSVAIHSTGAPLVERLAGEDAHRAMLRIRAAHIKAQPPRRRRAATTFGLFLASARPAWSRRRSRMCPSSSATGATRTAWPRQRTWSSRPSRLCSTTTQGWSPIPRAVGAFRPSTPPPRARRPPRLGSGMCMVATMCTLCSGRCAQLRPRAWGAMGRCSSSRGGSPHSARRRWVGGPRAPRSGRSATHKPWWLLAKGSAHTRPTLPTLV